MEVLSLRFAVATGDRNWEAEVLAAAHRLSGTPIYFEKNGERVLNAPDIVSAIPEGRQPSRFRLTSRK